MRVQSEVKCDGDVIPPENYHLDVMMTSLHGKSVWSVSMWVPHNAFVVRTNWRGEQVAIGIKTY